MDGSLETSLKPIDRTPCPSPQQLLAILQLGPDDSFSIQMRGHLDECPQCQEQLDRLTAAPHLTTLKNSLDRNSGAELGGEIEGIKIRFRQRLFDRGSEVFPPQQSGFNTQAERETPALDIGPSDTIKTAPTIDADNDSFSLSSEEPQAAIPARIGRYEVLGLLGRGGMGTVYLGYDLELNRKIALKTLNQPRADLQARLQREAQAIAHIDSAHVVRMHALETDDHGQPFLVMEYVEGESLADRLLRVGRLPVEEAVRICRTAALGVQAAHDQKILHRDVKPSNILIDTSGRTRVADFGLAVFAESASRLTPSSVAIGTPAYWSPEQASGNKPTARSDVYGLGCLLYETLTGLPLYQGSPVEILRRILDGASPPSLRANDRSIPVELEVICSKALSADPESRYARPEEFADDLQRWLSGEPISARPVSTSSKVWRQIRRHPVRSSLVALFSVAMIGTLAFTVMSAREKQSLARRAAEMEWTAEANRQALEKQRDLALKQLQESVFQTNDLLRDRAGTLELRKSLLESALDSLAKVRGGESQPLVDRSTALAYLRLGQIQMALGDFDDGQASLRTAGQLVTDLHATSPDDIETCGDLAAILASQGEAALAARNLAEAEELFQQALQLRQVLLQLDGNQGELEPEGAEEQNARWTDAQKNYVMNLILIGDVRRSAGDNESAEPYFIQANERASESLSRWPDDLGTRRAYALSLNRLAGLALGRNQADLALTYLRRWKEQSAGLLALEPRNTEYQLDNALAIAQIARIYTLQGNFDEATDYASQATQLYRSIADADPENPTARSRHAISSHAEGDAWYAAGKLDEAHRSWMLAAEIHESLFDRFPSNTRYTLLGGESLLWAGIVNLGLGQIELGLELLNQGYDFMRQGQPKSEENPQLESQLEGVRTLVDSFETAAGLRACDPETLLTAPPSAVAVYAYFLSKSGEIDKAVEIANSLSDVSDADTEVMINVHSRRAAVYAEAMGQETDNGSPEPVAEYRSLAIESLETALGANPQWIHLMRKSPDFLPLRSDTRFQQLADRATSR